MQWNEHNLHICKQSSFSSSRKVKKNKLSLFCLSLSLSLTFSFMKFHLISKVRCRDKTVIVTKYLRVSKKWVRVSEFSLQTDIFTLFASLFLPLTPTFLSLSLFFFPGQPSNCKFQVSPQPVHSPTIMHSPCKETSIYVKNRFISLRVWRLILTYSANPFVFVVVCVPASNEGFVLLPRFRLSGGGVKEDGWGRHFAGGQ